MKRTCTRKVDKLVEDLGLKIDKSAASRLCKELDNGVDARNRQLTGEYPYVWLDATFPKAHHPQIYSTNPLERLNKKISRHSNVVSIFPNMRSVTRLISSVLIEQQDEWLASEKRYMSLESMAKLKTLSQQPLLEF